MHAVLLSIGDELTLGQTVDTNSAFLAAKLVEHGIAPLYHLTVPDDTAAITRAFRDAAAQADLVIATGGLGPTDDDLTRQALADALGVPLLEDPTALENVHEFFRRLNRPMAAKNLVQALIPRGAAPLHNPTGTAPGIRATLGTTNILCFPGVPSELFRMFDLHILPLLEKSSAAGTDRVILTEKINTYGEGESNIAVKLGDLMNRRRNPVVGTTVARGIVSIRIRSEFPTRAEAQRELDATIQLVKDALGNLVFSTGDSSLAEVVNDLLLKSKQTLAVAESCTGGLLGKLITDVPGSSAIFLGGWLVYSNNFKNTELNVPQEMLAQHGAVSEPVALALADAARAKSGADFALAITGIAGPTGGSPEKPVGTVWIALAQSPSANHRTLALRFTFPGDRQNIRDRAAKTALNMLRLQLIGLP